MNEIERNRVNSDLLHSFLVVAEVQNITHAADRLGRTQSAVSVQMRKLEEALAVRLFDRQARGMTLTEHGRTLLPAASRAVSELGKVGALFAEPLSGRIRVGIPDDYNDMILERALADFGRQHPGVEVFARSGCTAGFPEAIARNDLDLAVSSDNSASAKDAFHSEPVVWAAGLDFDGAADDVVPLVILDRNCWWRDLPANALDAIKRPWRRAYVSENFASAQAAMRAGLAVGVTPLSAVDDAMKVLSQSDGFPTLPMIHRAFLVSRAAPERLVAAMSNAIRKAQSHGT
ncbi:MAG: LysR family transcriptional regulator [Pseudomonadota bacterium]